ncbi:MAG TPA: VanZ family protein [Pyrinomonadaceae bacterium]|nr:VanZ family protein [Pyrinomonadaceae bacterium]
MIDEEALPAANIKSATSRNRLWRYGPLIVWAALIFIGSSSILSGSNTSPFLVQPIRWLFPTASDSTLQLVHLLIRKAGHLTEYAILAWLAARAFRTSSNELLRHRWFLVAFILIALYSLSDEFHQSFVPSRGASLHDCAIDSVGGLLALLFLAWRHSVRTGSGSDRIKTSH